MTDRAFGKTERRRLLSVARKYRRDGYRVTIPVEDGQKPAFLGDHVPDLIAESGDDRVVVEVKRVTALPNSNDLVDLARRVEGEAGWRLELVTLGVEHPVEPRAYVAIADLKVEIDALLRARFVKAAFISAWAAVEHLLSLAAVRNGLDPTDSTYSRLARDLVVHGVISIELRDEIQAALTLRHERAHPGHDGSVDRSDVESLLALYDKLHEEMTAEQAA